MRVTVKLDDSGLREGFKRLKNVSRKEVMEKAVMAGGQVIESQAKINANDVFSAKATNTLANSIRTEMEESGDHYAVAAVGPTVIYGRIQELGGWVKTVHAKALRFVIDGVEYFKKAVYIPARPYLRPAADENQEQIAAAVGSVIREEIENSLR